MTDSLPDTAAHRAGCLVERTSGQKCNCGAAQPMARSSVTAWERWPEQPLTSGEVIGGCEPLIEATETPYKGVAKMTALDVQCPYCNAAPTEPCRSVRTPVVAPTSTYSSQPAVAHRHISRPHPERADAARRGQVRA